MRLQYMNLCVCHTKLRLDAYIATDISQIGLGELFGYLVNSVNLIYRIFVQIVITTCFIFSLTYVNNYRLESSTIINYYISYCINPWMYNQSHSCKCSFQLMVTTKESFFNLNTRQECSLSIQAESAFSLDLVNCKTIPNTYTLIVSIDKLKKRISFLIQ